MTDTSTPSALPSPGQEGVEPPAITTAWRIHASLAEWTGRADTKASTALSVELAVLAGGMALVSSGRGTGPDGTALSAALMASGMVLVLLSVLLAAAALLPRSWKAPGDPAATENFIYFGTLRSMPSDQVATMLRETDVLEVLSGQLVTMSHIAWRKLILVKYSLVAACSGLVLVSLAVWASV
ncbi:Pycsar system effector family protein [Streptomyces sp. NPDC058052]|uniref:Pycsar system effector family protein n=1 Tax=Streptomyces sp. NPDC058052 TaxID=3346316 RepID=UPI0036EAC3BF